jgi:hypothetical protein
MNKFLKFLIYSAVISLLLLGIMTLVFNIPKRFENELMKHTEVNKFEMALQENNQTVDNV